MVNMHTDADCLEVGESQGSSQCLVKKHPVKPPRPEGDSQKVQEGNDQEKVQSKRNSHSKTEVGKTKLTIRY